MEDERRDTESITKTKRPRDYIRHETWQPTSSVATLTQDSITQKILGVQLYTALAKRGRASRRLVTMATQF